MVTMPTSAQQAELAKYDLAYRAPNYHMSEQRAAAIRRTLEELPHRSSYLDVSCGRGEMLRYAREIGFATVAGTEVVPELIGGDISYALAWELPFGDRSFEVATLLDVIEHLLPGDDEAACRELARVATRAVLLTANNLPSHPHGDPTIELHVNKRPYPEWDQLFRAWFSAGKVTWLKHRVAKRSELWLVEL